MTLNSSRSLIRLYDLPEDSGLLELAGAELRLVTTSFEVSPRFDAVPVTGRRIRACLGADMVGEVKVGTTGRACVDEGVTTAQCPVSLRDEVRRVLTAAALSGLSWAGYAYAECSGPADRLATWFPGATWEIPEHPSALSPVERDARELAWGDIYVDLRQEGKVVGPPVPSFCVRRPEAAEQQVLVEWIRRDFGAGWASEFSRAFANTPISAMIAVQDGVAGGRGTPVGFIAYDCARLGMLSTFAFRPEFRGQSTLAGKLLGACLQDIRRKGDSFTILGGVSRRLAALRFISTGMTVPGSCPGIFGKAITEA